MFTHTNYLRKLRDTLSDHRNRLLYKDRNIRGKQRQYVISYRHERASNFFLNEPRQNKTIVSRHSKTLI